MGGRFRPERPADLTGMHTLLRSLATVCRNQVVPNGLPEDAAFDLVTQPTELQARALALAGASLASA